MKTPNLSKESREEIEEDRVIAELQGDTVKLLELGVIAAILAEMEELKKSHKDEDDENTI